MVIIVGNNAEKSRFKAGKLFGQIFPEQEFVIAQNRAVINAPSAAVIVEKNASAEIKAALGIIADEDGSFDEFPRGVQLITCGVNQKNTVSFTSRSNDKITLSLNRAIRAKNGIAEPLELPAKLLNELTEFDYMAAFAASLLLRY